LGNKAAQKNRMAHLATVRPHGVRMKHFSRVRAYRWFGYGVTSQSVLVGEHGRDDPLSHCRVGWIWRVTGEALVVIDPMEETGHESWPPE
jgi:hypothetical protein